MFKVMRVIARLNIGGPAIHTILLSSEFNKGAFCSDLLVCGRVGAGEGDMGYLAKEEGVAPIDVPDLGREISFASDLRALGKLYAIMKRERPDIVHTHTAKAGALGRVAALCAGVPIRIHTFHGHIFDGYFNPLKARIFLYIERVLGFFTDRVIVVSEAVREEIVERLKVVDREKCVVIPLGFRLEKFLKCEERKGELRRARKIDADALLVGIVGRLVPIKNHRMFLDAVRIVCRLRPGLHVRFLVIGDGELRMSLESYAREIHVDDVVAFTGWIADLPAVYADLDVVALTSLNEGTPVSLIEAMAAARPVVATRVGGVGDIVQDGERGFLVGSNDTAAFAEKLLTLLEGAELRLRFGLCGRKFVNGRYSKDRLLGDMQALYRECLGSWTGRSE